MLAWDFISAINLEWGMEYTNLSFRSQVPTESYIIMT